MTNPTPPDTAGLPISEEDVRLRGLPDGELLKEFAGLESLMRFTSGASWGANDALKPLVSSWYQGKLRLYLAEVVRRAAAARGVGVEEREPPSRVSALLSPLREPPPRLSDPCPHPDRGGRHEVYSGSEGPFCRACGAR